MYCVNLETHKHGTYGQSGGAEYASICDTLPCHVHISHPNTMHTGTTS